MKKITPILMTLCALFLLNSCATDRDDEIRPLSELEIKNFIYSGMQLYYLYKPQIPELANAFFETQTEFNTFLNGFESPESLFYNGLVADVDRFSFITDDYLDLENSFAGISKTSGIDYGVALDPGDPNFAFAFVRYVLPNTSASESGVLRGMLFNTINGERLTTTTNANGSYSLSARSRELLASDSFTIQTGIFDANDDFQPSGTSYALIQEEYTENPVFIAKTLDIEGKKIGYLMYNAYRRNFDQELNAAFAQFQTDGIEDLVLDLRYNGGGSVETAIDLTSMITGQFDGQIVTQQQWNPEIQAAFEAEDPESLIDRFDSSISNGNAINSLNLNRLYVIGTGSTASASELTIIGLDPYIDVQTIGTTTVGKFQASITLYDSDSFGKNDESLNLSHRYAIQPLVYTYSNAADLIGPPAGISPDFELAENISNLGTLGDPDEPLLSLALDQILRRSTAARKRAVTPFEIIGERQNQSPFYQRMYIEEFPFPNL
ncbi:S41 family peptidase [Leeuwenhoekiella marinoflava]|uniref:C-terminal processing protease CtpA/Prc n=2 Tax=Leeuwenhoekiella marinoflava TaxID=988 RepID=A0A4Q0PMC9_9FLAO|nr:S41 family peptidase [Leeuwenhoekiella marinoflava]RXG30804.1 C-terminal processing protease CtpA/Prc [Leeuwenhoekiella marinoflava]SHF15948.1 C-terminal processing protease CtpA/Prc, contains a PDZ domain [Leeuwenhoekiella marinoflava DSM 3653]